MVLLEIISTSVVVFGVYMLIRNRFDKLRHIPQPFAWPILKHYPYFWNTDHLDTYANLSKDYKKHELFRLSNLTLPEQVVLLNPEFPKHVFSRPDLYHRSDLLKKACPFFDKGLLLAKGEEHRWQKSILSRAFTPEKQRRYVAVSNTCADKFVQVWQDEVLDGGTNVEVLKPFQTLSFEIMCKVSCSWDGDGDETESRFLTSTQTILDLITSGSKTKLFFRIFPFLDYLPFGPGKVKQKAIKEAHDEILKIMAKRKEEIKNGTIPPENENDFLSILFRAQEEDPDKRMSDQHVHDNIFTFLLGAFETTSTALMWVLYVFGIHPEVQKKARAEVNEILDSRNVISTEDISRMKYLTNVIRETLRIYNSSIRVGRVTAKECKIGNYWLPKGQMIKTVFNLFHMNEDLFPEPNKFKPERFDESGNIKPGSWLAFGYGPYSCIGQKFAMNEMRVILTKLLRNFHFSVDDDKRSFIRSIAVAIRASPEVTIRIERLKETDTSN